MGRRSAPPGAALQTRSKKRQTSTQGAAESSFLASENTSSPAKLTGERLFRGRDSGCSEGCSGGCSTPCNVLKLWDKSRRFPEKPSKPPFRGFSRVLSLPSRSACASSWPTWWTPYLSGHDAGQIKETVIGVDVFGRGPGYDPKVDGIVRTEARRLRLKLEEYYGGSGRQETLRIDLPKGAYVPFFLQTATAPAGGAARPAGPAMKPKIWPQIWPKLAAVGLLAAAIFGVLIARNRAAMPPVPRKFTTSLGNARSPVFSPDGARLAYSVDEHGGSRIMVAPLPAGPAAAWTDERSLDYEPAWSPDGQRIAFLRGMPSHRYEVRIAAGPLHSALLTEISGRDGVDWSPDGKWIAVADRVCAGFA